MKAWKPWKWFGRGLVGVSLVGGPGCLGFLHPLATLPHDQMDACKCLPKPCKDHVHVFFACGLDVLNCGNWTGVRDYVQALGFRKTYSGHLIHVPWFASEICRVRESDPDARIVLIGYGLGGDALRCLAKGLDKKDVAVDLLLSLDGENLTWGKDQTLPNVGRVVGLKSCWFGLEPAGSAGVETTVVTGVGPVGLPSHGETLRVLALELGAVASGVPFVAEDLSMPAPYEETPTPRPVTSQAPPAPDDWGFLRPVSRLRPSSQGIDKELPRTVPVAEEQRARR